MNHLKTYRSYSLNLFWILFALSTAAFTQTDSNQYLGVDYLKLDFQDGFKNDQIDYVKINECSLEIDSRISTRNELGYALLSVDLIQTNEGVIFKRDALQICVDPLDRRSIFDLEIKVNNRIVRRRINLENGKYIGISKKWGWFFLEQSPYEFFYD